MFRQAALLALALAPLSLAQVSEGFEGGWDETAWPIYAPDCNQGGAVSLDSSTAHGGTNSIKVEGAGGFCGHIFFGTENVPSGDLYVRAYMYVFMMAKLECWRGRENSILRANAKIHSPSAKPQRL
jgi:hypothetical protein